MTENDLTRIVGKYRKDIYRLALCYMKNTADADDVTQDAFLKLYTSGLTFLIDEEAKAWLIRTAANRCKDLLRSHWYKFSEPLDYEMQAPESEDGEEDLLGAVMSLPRKTRTVLYMYYYEEYPVKEIAEITGCTETAVTSQLWRGRKRLKELLKKTDLTEKRSELCDGLQ